jgi:hypothetical protein
MQDPVAGGVDLAGGQIRLLGEADQFRPCHQIGCGQDDFQPGGIRLGPVTGQVAQAGGLGLSDAVLDAGVLAVAQFQAGELTGDDTGGGVGDDAVTRSPSESVNVVSPGCGRSLRRISLPSPLYEARPQRRTSRRRLALSLGAAMIVLVAASTSFAQVSAKPTGPDRRRRRTSNSRRIWASTSTVFSGKATRLGRPRGVRGQR